MEDYIEYLKGAGHMDEAAVQLAKAINKEDFRSSHGKSMHDLWMDLCDIISKNPDKVTSLNVEPIIRSGLARFTEEVGHLWTSLADYFIRSAQFEKVTLSGLVPLCVWLLCALDC